MKELKIEETSVLISFRNYLESNRIHPMSESNLLNVFKLTIDAMVEFLKFSKHNAKHTVLKVMDLDNEFICAMEVSLDTDSDGNKGWVVGTVFNEEDLEITSDTKVYTNNDAVYLTSFKNTSKKIFREELEIDKEHFNILTAQTIKHTLEFAKKYFESANCKEITLELENVCKYTFTKNDDSISTTMSLHHALKQQIKADGRTDIIEEESKQE